MKTGSLVIAKALSSAALFLAVVTLFPENSYALSAVAQQVQGDVQVKKAGAENWQPIQQDTALATGDSVKTGQGSCVLSYEDQATFAVQNNTELSLEEKPASQDLLLLLGKIKGKVNKQKAEQPFQVVTPAAVATVRGTEVDFGFNEAGELTVDLHNGKVQVVNGDAELDVTLDGGKVITVQYQKDTNTIRVKNECGSNGPVQFKILGQEYSSNPCEEKSVELATAEGNKGIPGTSNSNSSFENPDEQLDDPEEGREPLSPIA